MRTIPSLSLIAVLMHMGASAQVLTPEDSLNAGLIRRDATTVLSGYGEVKVSYHQQSNTGVANVPRAVLFIGHRFSERISLFSELELEDARVAGGDEAGGGEFAVEQLVLKFDLDRDLYVLAGLLIPRIGIINENHLPTTFDGTDRPLTEQLLIPSVWREIGACVYGTSHGLGGLNWSLGVLNGLSSEDFENGSGIRGGRGEGSHASAANLAITGSLLEYAGAFRFQVSGYYGGSAGLTPREADSLQLSSGAFGTAVGLVEGDVQFNSRILSTRALATWTSIPEAEAINRAYANNTPSAMAGGYVEAAVDLLEWARRDAKKELRLFTRVEHIDLEASLPDNAITTGTNVIDRISTGLTYQPVGGVVIKADVTVDSTGDPNPALYINPYPQAQPFFNTNTFVNIGLGYSF